MKIRCFVLDDERNIRALLEDYIAKVPFLELCGQSDNPLTAADEIKKCDAHLLFLDMNMPTLSGLAFLRNNPSLPLTIIVTAHSEFALAAYKFKVIDYVLKPIDFEQFFQAVTKAKEFIRKDEATIDAGDDYFFIKSGTTLEKVMFNELLYIEAKNNYVELHTSGKKIMALMTIKSIEESLPPKKFIQIHKSYIVNIDKITRIDMELLYIGNEELPISRSYKNDLLTAIQDKIIKR